MKKSAFNYNVDKETAEEFAVVPYEDLQAVAMLSHVIGKQIAVLDTMLEPCFSRSLSPFQTTSCRREYRETIQQCLADSVKTTKDT